MMVGERRAPDHGGERERCDSAVYDSCALQNRDQTFSFGTSDPSPSHNQRMSKRRRSRSRRS